MAGKIIVDASINLETNGEETIRKLKKLIGDLSSSTGKTIKLNVKDNETAISKSNAEIEKIKNQSAKALLKIEQDFTKSLEKERKKREQDEREFRQRLDTLIGAVKSKDQKLQEEISKNKALNDKILALQTNFNSQLEKLDLEKQLIKAKIESEIRDEERKTDKEKERLAQKEKVRNLELLNNEERKKEKLRNLELQLLKDKENAAKKEEQIANEALNRAKKIVVNSEKQKSIEEKRQISQNQRSNSFDFRLPFFIDPTNLAFQAIGKITNALTQLASFITDKFIAAVSSTIEEGTKFRKTLNLIGAQGGATQEELAKIQEESLKLGTSLNNLGFDATEANKAILSLVKAGISIPDAVDAAKDVLALSRSAQNANGDLLDLEQSAAIVARSIQIFGLSGKDAARVADVFAGASKEALGEIGDFGIALRQVGSSAKSNNLTLLDTITILTALARNNLIGSDAGTGTRVFLSGLAGRSAEATKAIESLGIKFFDAKGNTRPFIEIINELQKALKGLSDQSRSQKLLQIFGQDAQRVAEVLERFGDVDFIDLKKRISEVGINSKVAASALDDFSGRVQVFFARIRSLQIKIFSPFEKELKEIQEVFNGVFEAFLNTFSSTGQELQESIDIKNIIKDILTQIKLLGAFIFDAFDLNNPKLFRQRLVSLAETIKDIISLFTIITGSVIKLLAISLSFNKSIRDFINDLEKLPFIFKAINKLLEIQIKALLAPLLPVILVFEKLLELSEKQQEVAKETRKILDKGTSEKVNQKTPSSNLGKVARDLAISESQRAIEPIDTRKIKDEVDEEKSRKALEETQRLNKEQRKLEIERLKFRLQDIQKNNDEELKLAEISAKAKEDLEVTFIRRSAEKQREKLNLEKQILDLQLQQEKERLSDLNELQTTDRASILTEITKVEREIKANRAEFATSFGVEEAKIVQSIKEQRIEAEEEINKIKIQLLREQGKEAEAASLESQESFRKQEIESRRKILAIEKEIGFIESSDPNLANRKNLQRKIQLEELLKLEKQILQTKFEQNEQTLLQSEIEKIIEDVNKKRAETDIRISDITITGAASGESNFVTQKKIEQVSKEAAIEVQKLIQELDKIASTGQINPKLLQDIQKLKEENVSTLSGNLLEKFNNERSQLDQLIQNRQELISLIDSSNVSIVEKERQRREVILNTNVEIENQLASVKELALLIAQLSGNTQPLFDTSVTEENLNRTKQSTREFGTLFQDIKTQGVDALANGLGDVVLSLSEGFGAAGAAFRNLVSSILSGIAQMIIKFLVLKAITAGLKFLGFADGGSILGGGSSSGGSGTPGAATGGNIGSLPPSIAGNGGRIRGKGTGTSDSILAFFPAANRLAKVSNTEFVINARATKQIGEPFLNVLNRTGSIEKALSTVQGFASGGSLNTNSNEPLFSGFTKQNNTQKEEKSPINIINMVNSDNILEGVSSSAGSKFLLNTIGNGNNVRKVRDILGITDKK